MTDDPKAGQMSAGERARRLHDLISGRWAYTPHLPDCSICAKILEEIRDAEQQAEERAHEQTKRPCGHWSPAHLSFCYSCRQVERARAETLAGHLAHIDCYLTEFENSENPYSVGAAKALRQLRQGLRSLPPSSEALNEFLQQAKDKGYKEALEQNGEAELSRNE